MKGKMMSLPPFRKDDDGVDRVHVLSERCDTCVFRPGNLMSLNPGRMKDLVETNRERDTAFACHQTIYRDDRDQAICRGYYDAYGKEITPLRMATAFGIIAEVEPPTKQEKP
jgi:hypothetical protein